MKKVGVSKMALVSIELDTGDQGWFGFFILNFLIASVLFWIFFFLIYVRYSKLHHLPSLRFRCVRGCWDRTQDCCDFGIDSQTL
jgi:hypothetical protein